MKDFLNFGGFRLIFILILGVQEKLRRFDILLIDQLTTISQEAYFELHYYFWKGSSYSNLYIPHNTNWFGIATLFRKYFDNDIIS
jgi:hypothetical protein